MRKGAQRGLVWRLLTALLAVALVVSAPVAHAAPQTCLDGHHQVVGSDAADATSKSHHLPQQSCCSVICVFCLAFVAQPVGSAHSYVLLSRVVDVSDNVAGRAPFPEFEPPRSMAG